jgi:hypothetical protein
MTFRTGSANLNARQPSPPKAHEERQRERVRSNEAALEIAEAAISDESIHGIVVDWLVPAIVDRAMKSILRYAKAGAPLPAGGYYEHNNLEEASSNDEEFEGWAASEASPAKADTEAPTVADECGIQSVERVGDAAEFDGE